MVGAARSVFAVAAAGAAVLVSACGGSDRTASSATSLNSARPSAVTTEASLAGRMPRRRAPRPPHRFQAVSSALSPAFRRGMTSWHPGCPVAPTQLRMLTLTYWGFDRRTHSGQVVVNADARQAIIAAVRDLFIARFPIRQMRVVEEFRSDDDRSMAADNTSAFNCRIVPGSAEWSQHAYGRAIDINPKENPEISGGVVSPPAGGRYVDRSEPALGMIMRVTRSSAHSRLSVGVGEALGALCGTTSTFLRAERELRQLHELRDRFVGRAVQRGPMNASQWELDVGGLRLTLSETPVVLGRDPECDVPLVDGRISWRHVKVELVDGVPLITDLGSRNGSYLDGKRLTITSALIAREAIVQIGGVRARIRETEPESVSTQGRFRRVPLRGHVVRIGRADDSDIVLGEPNISWHHAEVRPGEPPTLIDLGSRNGVRLGNQLVQGSAPLHPGVPAGIGPFSLRYEAGEYRRRRAGRPQSDRRAGDRDDRRIDDSSSNEPQRSAWRVRGVDRAEWFRQDDAAEVPRRGC